MNLILTQSGIVKLVEKYYADLQLIIDSSPYKSKWDCKKLCSFCCNGPIIITFSEIIYIADKIKANVSRCIELHSKFKKYIEYLNKCDSYFEHTFPCVFLKNETCTIYYHRPSVCRKYFSVNKMSCIQDNPIATFIDDYCQKKGKYLLNKFKAQLIQQNLPYDMEDFHVGIFNLLYMDK